MTKIFNLTLIVLLLFTACEKGSDGSIKIIPLAPSSLNAVQASPTQINLSWTDNSTNETGFKIERKLTNGTYEIIGTTNADITNYSDNNVIQAAANYVYRVYSYNSVGNSLNYSNEASVNSTNYPVISTNNTSQISISTATSGGNISSDGGTPIIARGVVWSTSTNPTIDLTTKTIDGTGIGSFSSSLTNLTVNTTYFIRAYATNSVGTAYGNERTFKTLNQGITVAGGNGEGSAANQFKFPGSVFVDASGNIYVADMNNNRIQKWAPGATTGITVAGGNGEGSAANQFYSPIGVFVDASGNIYVSDINNQRIQKWAPGATSGTTVAGGNGYGSAANQISSPNGVFVDASGNIYFSDNINHRIQKWAPGATTGITVAGGNGEGSAANQLYYPRDIFVDASGYIYVADMNNNRIQKWAPGATSGITVAGGNAAGGAAANQFALPTGLFVDASGNIYVADTYNYRIQKWAPGATSGTTVAGGNGLGSAANQFSYPTGLFVDASGNIYVADSYNHRIQKWAN